jgi:hypothetical protein
VTIDLAREVANRIGAMDGVVAVTLGGSLARGRADQRSDRDTRVDLLYRDLRLVDRVLDDCAAGRTTCAYQPGHPHGFHGHSYAGEVHHGLALHDPAGLRRRRGRRPERPAPGPGDAGGGPPSHGGPDGHGRRPVPGAPGLIGGCP